VVVDVEQGRVDKGAGPDADLPLGPKAETRDPAALDEEGGRAADLARRHDCRVDECIGVQTTVLVAGRARGADGGLTRIRLILGEEASDVYQGVEKG
jgi:hypothetical protein